MTDGAGGSGEMWRHAVDNAPIGIALMGFDSCFIDVNEALAEVWGYRVEDLIGKPTSAVGDPELIEEFAELGLQLLAGTIPRCRLRRQGRRADGTLMWAEIYLTLARDEDGNPLHFVAYIEDVSEHVATAARLDRINQDLIRQTTRLARSNDDLEAFATVASHDLKAPLATIRGYLELLQGEYAAELGQNGRLWLGRAAGAGARMAELLTSLLEFSRATGGGQPHLRPVAVDAVLQRVLADLDGAVSSADLKLHLVDAHTEVLADPPRLHQVLQNLVENALKYRHPERLPEVTVRVVEEPDTWRIEVADNGIGVPEGDRDSVFAMFHQGGHDDEGFGIGLAVTRRIVERHGGSIWVEPVPGGGSSFSFTLPRS